MAKYYTQVLIVREVLVEADDDLQAERQAFQSLPVQDQGAAIAHCVLNRTDPDFADDKLGHAGLGGALAYDDTAKNWKFAREHFDAIDMEWVQ